MVTTNPDLADYLLKTIPGQRWFVSKSKEITGIEEEDSLDFVIGGERYKFINVRVDFENSHDNYFLYLKVDSESPGGFSDALSDTAFVKHFHSIFRDGAEIRTSRLAIKGEPYGNSNNDVDVKQTRLLRGEQSNNSVVLDGSVIMKIYRRLTDYESPDYQIPLALALQTSFNGTPACLGSIRYTGSDSDLLLATFFRFVENAGDLWNVLTGHMNRSADEGRIEADLMIDEVRSLGKLTAEMHNALASLRGDDFTPVPATIDDLSAWMTSFSDNALLLGRAHKADSAFPDIKKLADRARELLSSLQNSPFYKIRIHGDYHLGQVLKGKERLYVIDFEGEPMRSLEFRRLRHSALKDVSGMLRSLDYAASYCTRGEANRELAEAGKEWAASAGNAYLESYMKSVDSKMQYLPEGSEETRNLLDFFILDKALYEFNYEINNRPDWADIPLNAIREVLGDDD